MLGPAKARQLEQPIAVSLETLVPADNFYRHLEATLDLSFVREWTRELYAPRGRPSIDPVVFFKLQLIMFFEGIRSERQLIATASLHLAHRWYLGYALDERLPDHSSLTRIRQRLGVAVFQRFFERIVDECQAAGLVWGRELYFDATVVEANAALSSLVPRVAADATPHLHALFGEAAGAPVGEAADGDDPGADGDDPGADGDDPGADGDDPGAADPPPDRPPGEPPPDRPLGIVPLPGACGTDATGERPWPLLEAGRLDPDRPSHHSRPRTTDTRVSRTDPDATPLWDWGVIRLGYHHHYVVDGGKRRIILTAFMTLGDVMDNAPMRDLLWRTCFRRKLWPRQVTGDSKYATTENIVAIEDAGIRAYLPLPAEARTKTFGRSGFTYEAEVDQYRCPEHHPLPRRGVKHTEGVVVYRAAAAVCNACPVKAQCTTSDHGRMLHRSVHAATLERVRGYQATAPYQKAMRKRKVWPEPLFAEAKQWHGLARLRLRGLANATIQGVLIATGQNLKRLLAARGWGRRHAPCGSLVALPTPPVWLGLGSG